MTGILQGLFGAYGTVPPTITSFTPTTAGSGTNITITGTKFTGATSVTFGALSSPTFTVNSDTQIVAEAPFAASGTVSTITVTTPSGSGTSATNFTFGTPLWHSVTDDFTTADTTKWTFASGTSVTSGQLLITANTNYPGVVSKGLYSLVNSYISTEFVNPLASSLNYETGFAVCNSGNTSQSGWRTNFFTANQIQVYTNSTVRYTATYSSTTYRYLRIANDGTNILYQSSSDNASWTTRYSQLASGAAFTSSSCGATYWGGTNTNTNNKFVYDNFNL